MALSKIDVANMLTGTTPVANGGTGVTTSAALANTGNLVLLSSQTASDDANISFTSGIDSTYDQYIFKFQDIHPATDNVDFRVLFSTDGTNFNQGITGAGSITFAKEDNTNYGHQQDGQLNAYTSGNTFMNIAIDNGADNDQSLNGELRFYSPSNTTFKKHFYSEIINSQYNNHVMHNNAQGYIPTTSAITGVRFALSSGNIQSGTIFLYGVKS